MDKKSRIIFLKKEIAHEKKIDANILKDDTLKHLHDNLNELYKKKKKSRTRDGDVTYNCNYTGSYGINPGFRG